MSDKDKVPEKIYISNVSSLQTYFLEEITNVADNEYILAESLKELRRVWEKLKHMNNNDAEEYQSELYVLGDILNSFAKEMGWDK